MYTSSLYIYIVICIHHRNMDTSSLYVYILLHYCYMYTLIYIYIIVIFRHRYICTSSLYVYIFICIHQCYLFLSLLHRYKYPSLYARMCIFVQICIIICIEITVPAHMYTSFLYVYMVIICIHRYIIDICVHRYICICVYMYKYVSL